MTSARKIKLKVTVPHPRNPLVAPTHRRKAGAHRKSKKTARREAHAQIRRELRDER